MSILTQADSDCDRLLRMVSLSIKEGSIRRMRFITQATAGLLFLISSISVSGQSLDCGILQYKLDRLYFPHGTESDLFKYSPFTVYLNSDSIYAGTLEFSGQGVSYSFPTYNYFDTLNIALFHTILEPAIEDTLTKITIGISEFDMPEIGICLIDSGSVLFRQYDSHIRMLLDFEEGFLDGYLSYGTPDTYNKETGIAYSYAPYYAVIMPNLSSGVNYHGLLSTSLYYRFDPSQPYTYFDGNRVIPQDCFYDKDDSCFRAYYYNTEDGRRLLESMRQRPKRISISTSDRVLDITGQLFADILSRDRIRTDFVAASEFADIRLTFIEYDSNQPLTGFNNILDLLAHDTAAGDIINKSLELAAVYLQSARCADHPKKEKHYLEKTERVLKEDLGVFPLFRPTVYFIANRALKGYRFDDDGYLDLTETVRLLLPVPNEDKPR